MIKRIYNMFLDNIRLRADKELKEIHDFRNLEFEGHIMSPGCPCGPRLEYKDPVTGNEVWIHNKPN